MDEAAKIRRARMKEAAARKGLPQGLVGLAGMTEEQLTILEREKERSFQEGQAASGWWKAMSSSVLKVLWPVVFAGLLVFGHQEGLFDPLAETIRASFEKSVPQSSWEPLREVEGGTLQELRVEENVTCWRAQSIAGNEHLGCTGVKKVTR